jgi:hypothetical protein
VDAIVDVADRRRRRRGERWGRRRGMRWVERRKR